MDFTGRSLMLPYGRLTRAKKIDLLYKDHAQVLLVRVHIFDRVYADLICWYNIQDSKLSLYEHKMMATYD